MALDLRCLDWADRLRLGKSLVPNLELPNNREGERAVRVFNNLRLHDAFQTPRLEDACGDWFRDIVRVLFSSLDPFSKQRMIRELFLMVPKKQGKALALDTQIATPAGFTTMGALQIGDQVLDAAGRPTEVLAKSEVFLGHDCYEIEFSTGEKVVADADHLWVTDAHLDRERLKTRKHDLRKTPCPTVKTTREISESVEVKSGRFTIRNHRTALPLPLDLPPAGLPIAPYVLGAWLGDGHSSGAVITSDKHDAAHMIAQLNAAGQSARVVRADKRSNAVYISLGEPNTRNRKLPYRFLLAARALGVVGDKRIPAAYLRASFLQRLALLRGLMDTDGCISIKGQACFCTSSPALRDDVLELINSLGFKGCAHEQRAKLRGKDCGPCWRIQFYPFDDQLVFTIPRKAERQRASTSKNAARSRTRQIVAVRQVPSVPTQCITVDSHTEQFLITRSLIPTHNTSLGALLMLTTLLLNERPHAPMIMTAPVQDVAEKAFEAAAGAIELDDVLKRKLHVIHHRKIILHRETKAKLEIMTFDPSVLTGQKCVAILIDELHVVGKMHKAASAIRQLRGGMLPFPEAFLVFITTQSEEAPSGVFKAELKTARDIRDGRSTGVMLPVLYEFPMSYQKDPSQWRDPGNWHMVTPGMGTVVTKERLVEEFDEAEKKGVGELIAWASQHLDVEVGLAIQSDGWAGADYWEARADEKITLAWMLANCEVIDVGIDGGGLDDLLGLGVAGRVRGSDHWVEWNRAWAHPIVLERRKSESERLMDFVKDGDLILVKSIGDDVRDLCDIVERIFKAGLLDLVGVDRAGIASIINELAKRGIKPASEFSRDEGGLIVAIQQGWTLTGVIKTTERRLAEGTLTHSDSPMMAWCAGNAKVEQRGNAITITKQAAGYAKIDPLLAGFNALDLLSRNPLPPRPVYQLMFVG